jgi:hypothetical protein
MNLLIVGSAHYSSYEQSCARYFIRHGIQVSVWDNKRIFSEPRSLWWRLGLGGRAFYDFIASVSFLRAVKSKQPDVIFMPKAENIYHFSVRKAKEITGAKLIVWYPDNPFRGENTSLHVLKNMQIVDIYYIWGKFLVDSITSAGAKRVEYLPFGFDPDLHLANPTSGKISKKIVAQHVGSFSHEKRDALTPLAKHGLEIWGPGWHEEIRNSGPLSSCVRGGGVYGRDLAELCMASLVTVNPIRLQNMPGHNLRTMEAAGIGASVVLTQRTWEQAEHLFAEGRHLLCYSSPQEMIEKVVWAKRHPDICQEMATAAQEHVNRKHLLEYRINKIVSDLGNLH